MSPYGNDFSTPHTITKPCGIFQGEAGRGQTGIDWRKAGKLSIAFTRVKHAEWKPN